jgi:hypothetical protein
VTNHTVTIAAELVSFSSLVGTVMRTFTMMLLFKKENGEKLVGQCEISHPVRTLSSTDVTPERDRYSPFDGMGEVISQRNNVMFNPHAKDEHEPLPARIISQYLPVRITPISQRLGRAILH